MEYIKSEKDVKDLLKRIKKEKKNFKPTIVVLCGGKSFEHDISILTAQTIANAVPNKYNVQIVYQALNGAFYLVPFDMKVSHYKDLDSLVPIYFVANSPYIYNCKGKKLAKIEVIINCTHGQNCEDGTLTHLFNVCGIASTNANPTCQAITLDKEFMKDVFISSGFDTPKYVVIKSGHNDYEQIIKRQGLDYPVIVKPANLGSSIGICVCEDSQSLIRGIEFAKKFDEKIIVEEFIDGVVEVNCSARKFNGEVQASGCEVPNKHNSFLTFDDKYCAGGKGVKQADKINVDLLKNNIINKTTFCHSQDGDIVEDDAPYAELEKLKSKLNDYLISSIQKLTIALYEKFDCEGVVRVDYLVKEDKIYVNEINTIPGSLAYYLWEENIEDFVNELILSAYKNFKEKNSKSFILETHILGEK